MLKGPRVEQGKITSYLLSTISLRGRSKAAFFLSFGFNADNWQSFAEALRLQGTNHDVVKVVETIHGSRYHVEGVLETPDGKKDVQRA